MTTRAVIYARCSTEEESQKDALIKQAEEARECVRSQGWLLMDSYVESKSGTSTRGRSEYSRLYEDLLWNKFDVIVIKSQDRLMRNVKDWYLFVDRLNTAQKRLYIYMEKKFYSADDGLITGIKAILAEEYSRELSKKINNAHRNRQKNGGTAVLTGNAYGFCKLPDKSVGLVEEEARIKGRMFRLCAAGYGSRTIANILRKDGVCKRSGKPFTDTDILRIIRNPMNKGTIVMNRQHYDFDTGQTMDVPREDWYIHENKVPPTVSPQLWARANAQVDKRGKRRGSPGAYRRNNHMLTGKIICGLCGRPYYHKSRRRYRDHEIIYDWICSGGLNYGRKDDREGCNNINLSEGKLMEVLQSACVDYHKPDREALTRRMVKILKQVLKEQDHSSELEHAQAKVKQIKGQMSLLVDKLLSGILSDDMYQQKQKELDRELEGCRENMEQLEGRRDAGAMLEERIANIREFLEHGDSVEKASMAAVLDKIERIVIYPQYMDMEWDFGDKTTIEYGNSFQYLEQKARAREQIVEIMKENPHVTAGKIAEMLDMSLSGVQYKIKVLRREGRIRYNGKNGRGYWEVLG